MKNSGMFWSEEGGQGVLDLRCTLLSDRLDSFCQARTASHVAENDPLKIAGRARLPASIILSHDLPEKPWRKVSNRLAFEPSTRAEARAVLGQRRPFVSALSSFVAKWPPDLDSRFLPPSKI